MLMHEKVKGRAKCRLMNNFICEEICEKYWMAHTMITYILWYLENIGHLKYWMMQTLIPKCYLKYWVVHNLITNAVFVLLYCYKCKHTKNTQRENKIHTKYTKTYTKMHKYKSNSEARILHKTTKKDSHT